MSEEMAINGHTNGMNRHANGNGVHGNGVHDEKESQRLKILIVGAGIGGLTAALALRKQGHEVVLFEQSQFASEVGAAMHLAPNANGILRRLGIFAEEFGANLMEWLTEYKSDGTLTRSLNVTKSNAIWQHPWLLAHRIHLHSALRTACTSPTPSTTIPCILNLSSRILSISPSTATLTLQDGTTHTGDLILGADGVKSVCRTHVAGRPVQPFSSGKSAFRFLITRDQALSNEKTKHLVEKLGELTIWYGADRRVVVYPTGGNGLLNFVCIHPESETDVGVEGDGKEKGGEETWNQEGNWERMVRVYEGFEEGVVELLKMADRGSLKVWKLLDMETLDSWVNDKVALLGDAAHPFTPHQGQGAGVAIEDAASLAVVLPLGTPREEIPERLKLYEKIRMERAHRIQDFSRIMGSDLKDDLKIDMQKHTIYNVGHDEWDNSTQALRKWTWARIPNIYWRMPIAFGPMPGPRQNILGHERTSTHSTFTTASLKFRTSRTVLQNLFPPNSSSYRFKSPGTIAYASFSQTTLGKMDWLGGSGYKHLGLYIHGVEYVKKNGDVISGTYMPLLFESLTDPIVSGREELGMPKLYSAIETHRREKSYRINTSWEGAFWGNFVWEGLREMDPATESGSISGEDDDGILVYRYIPSVGWKMRGKAEAEYPVFVPYKEDSLKPKTERVWVADKGSFKLNKLDVEALPTLHHVIERLAELPVYEVVSAKIVEGTGVPDVRAAQRIE